MNQIQNEISDLTRAILNDYSLGRAIDRIEPFRQPDKEVIRELIDELLRIIYPGYYRDHDHLCCNPQTSIAALIEDVACKLEAQIAVAMKSGAVACEIEDAAALAEQKTVEFLRRIPEIRALVDTDLSAGFDGDPAALSKDEIIIAYPGLYAVTINRLAHVLYTLGVPLIPRIMTEHAHSLTGIDIHPGATIGRYFFIDHGTGIVVGETTVIGDNVKVYQGVTLGALSTRGGQLLRGKRRHPTIEDRVTIYAGASILGGETVIGHDAVIGSNAFITHSIAPGTRVSIKNQELVYKGGEQYAARDENGKQPWIYTT